MEQLLLFTGDQRRTVFPKPQYLGAKYNFLPWIRENLPNGIDSALDLFAGTQSVAYMLKQEGLRVITNDLLNFNHQIGLALIENNNVKLANHDINLLINGEANNDYTLIEDVYAGLFFNLNDAKQIDRIRYNISLLDNKYKQAIAFSAACRALTRKVTMGHFAHTQALNYAADAERIKRNKSLVTPYLDIFSKLLIEYNEAVFDNARKNRSKNSNVLDLTHENIDFVYLDPPYCSSHADYQNFYHLLETFVNYWKEKEFINGIKKYWPQYESNFDKKSNAIDSFGFLFETIKHIPYWMLSYNNRSYPDIQTMKTMLCKYKNVTVKEKEYFQPRGGKGSVAGSKEVLFICSPK